MGVLVIDQNVKARALELKKHAERNVISLEEMKKAKDTGYVAGDDPSFTMRVPLGFRVVYTQEDQEPPLNRCHHLSVSLNKPGRAPNEHAVQMIAELFGVKCNVLEGIIWVEEEIGAVNVVIPLNESVLKTIKRKT